MNVNDERYEPMIEHSAYPRPGWLKVTKQDTFGHDGRFPWVRALLTGASVDAHMFNVAVEIYKNPPHEFPPIHMSDVTAGINLDAEQVTALRDACNDWLRDQNA